MSEETFRATVDASGVQRMLERFVENSRAIGPLVERAARDAMHTAESQAPRDTGALAAGFSLRINGPTSVDVVNDVYYARWRLRTGAYGRPPTAPNIPAEAIATQLATRVVREVFA